MTLIKVPALCTHRDKPPYDISEGSLDVPNCIFANVQASVGPQFNAFTAILPGDKADSDLFVLPRKRDVQIDWGVTTLGRNKLLFVAEFQLLDRKGIPIADIQTRGQSVFRLGSSFSQRANYMSGFYAGVGDSVASLTTNDLFRFFSSNSDFLNGSDATKASSVPQILATAPDPKTCAQQLVQYAAAGNHPRLLGELMKWGAGVNTARQDNGMSPLHLAALYNSPDSIVTLLSAGVDTEQSDRYRRLAVDYAIWNGRTEAVEAFLAANAVTGFSEWLPLASSAVWESFGDYYVSKRNREQAERCYAHARRCADTQANFSYPDGINGLAFSTTRSLGTDSSGRQGFTDLSVSIPPSSPYLEALGLNGAADRIRYFMSYGFEMSGFLAALRARSSTAGLFAPPPGSNGSRQSDFELELAVLTATQAGRQGILDEMKTRRQERESRLARKQSALKETARPEEFKSLVGPSQ